MNVVEYARKRPQGTLAVLLWLGFVASVAVSFNIVTYENGQPAAWYATSFLAGGLLLLKGRVRAIFAGACLVSLPVVISLNPEWPLYAALILTALAAVEAGLATLLTLRLSKTPRLANVKQLGKLLGMAVLPSILVTVTLAAILTGLFGEPFLRTFGQGLVSHFMGLGSMLPAILLLATPNLVKGPRKGWFEWLLLGGGILVFAAAPFTALSYATFLLIFPAATIFAFRLGAKQTVALIVSLTTLSLVMGYLKPDASYSEWGMPIAAIILIGQLYTMAVIYNALFTALAINHQARVKRHLQRRTEIARRSRSRALKASKAKSDFLATMSHELRTPLNGIMGFTQVLQRRPNLEPEVRQQLGLIETSGAALLTIVSDILDFAKVEAGRVQLRPEALQLRALAEESLAIVSPAAEQKGLRLTLEMNGGAASHLVDGARLRQVLLNLLNNAVKFTDAGEVSLIVTLQGDRARFEVRDTGVGIAADDTARLFQRFSQVDGSKTRNYGGAGLGLAICKGLVELMGGDIGVDSRPGEGSTFWFDIPLGVVETSEAPSAPEAEAQAQAETAAPHILLVDDHPVNRQLARTMLAMVGCTCDEAENGELAVEAVRNRPYDLILMDIHMPVMDGLAATRAIRAMAGDRSKTPIIAVTADILPECQEKCRAAGINEHIGKPLSLDVLIACINRTLEAAQGRDTLAA